jgi:DNA-binding winged helix-turn-helix (wHTH) protein
LGEADRVSFGAFVFDRRSGRLEKQGYRLKLLPKSAAVLDCLLAKSGAVVPRSELQRRLWPADTHVDFDLGIKVAVRRLRDVLDDSADQPKYIQTVHGEGYRFIASISAVAVSEPADVDEASPPPNALPRARWFQVYPRPALIATIAALVLLALGAFAWRPSRTLGFQSGDWVMIAAFENKTGEPLFTGSIEYALERALGQSSFVSVAPHPRIVDTLLLMRRNPDAVLDEQTAREIVLRDGGIRAVLAGRIENISERYLVSVRLVDPATGKTVGIFEKTGKQADVAEAVASLAEDIRRKLGETPAPGSDRLERATTTSLGALKTFTAGMRAIEADQWASGTALFEEATRQDPQFAYAHIYAAHCYSNVAQDANAAPHYEAAYRLASGVSERERLFILGSYYSRHQHDEQRAIAEFEALANLYPDDYWGAANLSGLYESTLNFDARIRMVERMVAIRPYNVLQLGVLLNSYKYVRPNPTRAAQVRNRLLRLRAAGAPGAWFLFDIDDQPLDAWRAGDVAGAARALARFHARANNSRDWWDLAKADLLLGRLREAEHACRLIAENVPKWLRYDCLTRVALEHNDLAAARKHFDAMLAVIPQHIAEPSEYGSIAAVMMARAGLIAEAQQFAKRLKPDAGDTVKAALLLDRGRTSDAIELLQRAWPPPQQMSMPRTGRYLGIDLLASALARAGRLDKATDVLQLYDVSSVKLMENFPWLHCRWQLAQLLRRRGRTDEAVRVEEELRHYLSQADEDHPLLQQLRARAAADAKVAARRTRKTPQFATAGELRSGVPQGFCPGGICSRND